MGIKEKIREYANKIGLPLFGVTSPEPLDYLREFLDQRKSKGYDTVFEKGWTASRRCEVKQHFPGARSVICVGLPYYQQPRKGGDQKNKGYLSLYTRGVDYHRVLKHKLKELALFVEGLVDGFEYMICVDTIPLVEKALAHRAGLGWQGKNSLLYSPHYGSWFFLGELITNLYLTPDTPIPNKCGGCNKCISSCPANAIKEHYILDAGKCISGVLQNPGIIPVEMRKKIGKNVFGCDICQVVCPHN
ncbi:MAG: tRNA epoxyqueuosine(34) reductase QueG, partial [Clostridia bacterium]|nr:tRNA epoxyqueuosine(34) reductase QueG [Clostridia bacterium]